MKYLLLLIITMSCSKTGDDIFASKQVLDNGFTSTQQYEILCWIIKKAEGYSPTAYKCQAGKKTIGWGFVGVDNVSDIHEADEIFRDIVNPLFKEVTETYPEITYLQAAVITSLYYNTGNLKAIKKSKFAKHLKRNEVINAVKAFKSWNKVRVGKNKFIVSKGLVNRRSYESKLLMNTFTIKDYIKLKKEISDIYIKNKS